LEIEIKTGQVDQAAKRFGVLIYSNKLTVKPFRKVL